MNSKVPVVPLVAALSVGAAGGFVLARFGMENRPSPTTAPTEQAVPVSVSVNSSDTSSRARTPVENHLAPGSLVPVTFSELDRELSLLKSMDLALRSERVSDLARAAVIDQPTAVLSLAESKLTPIEAEQFRATIVGRWAQADPTAALTWARQQPAAQRENLLAPVIRAWAKRDGQAALEFVAQVTELDLRQHLQMAAYGGMAEVDPASAWLQLEKLGVSAERAELAHLVLLSWVRKDGPQAAKHALEFWATDRNGSRAPEFLAAWLAQDSKAASEWLRTQPPGWQRNQLIVTSAGELARTQPVSALELAQSLPAGGMREQAIRGALYQWAQTDGDAAMRWAKGQNDPALLRSAQAAVVNYLSGVDPRKAAAMLAELPRLLTDPSRMDHLGNIGRQWGQRNPTEAMVWAKALPPRQQMEAIPAILGTQASTNPQGALAQAASVADVRTRRIALQMVLGEWGRQEPEMAGKWLIDQPDRRLLAEQAPGIVQMLAETDLAAAERLASQLPVGEARSQAISGMVGNLANNNLADALKTMEKLPPGSAKDATMQQVGWVWGQQDPAAAAKYALSQPETEGRTRLLESAAGEWARRDPAAGAEFWKELGPGPGRDNFAENLASHWAEADPQAAVKWVRSLPPGEGQSELVARVIGMWAQQSPVEAATYAGQLPEEFQEGAVRSVLDHYAEQDPATGAKWLAAFPDESLRNRMQLGFVGRWAQEDAGAAGEWLRTQPVGASQQAAIEEFTRTVASREPAAAWEWAGAVSNEQNRFALQQQAMEQWLRLDPEAAGRALNQTEWPENLKDDLRKRR